MDEGKVIDKMTFYREKFGEEKLAQIKQMVSARAKELGIEM